MVYPNSTACQGSYIGFVNTPPVPVQQHKPTSNIIVASNFQQCVPAQVSVPINTLSHRQSYITSSQNSNNNNISIIKEERQISQEKVIVIPSSRFLPNTATVRRYSSSTTNIQPKSEYSVLPVTQSTYKVTSIPPQSPNTTTHVFNNVANQVILTMPNEILAIKK